MTEAIGMKRCLAILAMALWTVLGLTTTAHAVCSLSTSTITFGNYDVQSTSPLDSAGTIVFRCGSTDFNIRVSLDKGGASSFTQRRMLNGNESLFYNVYLNAARTVIWGDGTNGTQTFFVRNPQPNNKDFSVPIFGRIPPRQDVRSGAYTNTLTMTLDF